jgi:hypothetical protein
MRFSKRRILPSYNGMSVALTINYYREAKMRLLVYFDGQFWTALFERNTLNGFCANRYVFGSEPKDGEILEFVNTYLVDFLNTPSSFLENANESVKKKLNPKRLSKLARKEINASPVSTKAQQALQLQLETAKKEKLIISKEKREELANYKRKIASDKKKQKHKGR